MLLDVRAVQTVLGTDGLDGWLLYDFHGSNPVASRLAGVYGSGRITTRRWYYFIPASGEPCLLVHAIERQNIDLPGRKLSYAGRRELDAGLRSLLTGVRRIAMEYSPGCANPYVSRVDAGTIESVRELGVEVVSSGDLIQRFEALWDGNALSLHQQASARLYRIKDRAFEQIARRMGRGAGTTEYEIQQLMVEWFQQEGLVCDESPIVSVQENAGMPHYAPTATEHRRVSAEELILLDLWGKLAEPGAVYADITWIGYTGRRAPEDVTRAFAAVVAARDAAVALVRLSARDGRDLRGWQVDRAARDVLEAAGYKEHILHRTGHSLGEQVHGNGVHMDDYETHDDRLLLPGTGFTVEPGLYFDRFGVRSEINMYFGDHDAVVTGPLQNEIVALT